MTAWTLVTMLAGLAVSTLVGCIAFDHVAERGRLRALPKRPSDDLRDHHRLLARFFRWHGVAALILMIGEIASVAAVVACAADGTPLPNWPLWCLHLTGLIYALFAVIAVMECRDLNRQIDLLGTRES